MTITTYFATHKFGRSSIEADAIIHRVNDTAAGNGDNRSWDATRAHVDAAFDPDTQQRLGIVIQAEEYELVGEEN